MAIRVKRLARETSTASKRTSREADLRVRIHFRENKDETLNAEIMEDRFCSPMAGRLSRTSLFNDVNTHGQRARYIARERHYLGSSSAKMRRSATKSTRPSSPTSNHVDYILVVHRRRAKFASAWT